MRVLATRRWLEKVVIGQKLCPFAPPVLARLRLCGSDARNEDEVVAKVAKEARLLHDGIEMQTRQPGAAVTETTLVVLPSLECTATWQAFVRLSWRLQAEAIADAGLAHALQLVLFHPSAVHSAYGEGPEDAADFAIRSPHPTVHLLREVDMLAAVKAYPDVAGIPARNKARLRALGPSVCAEALAGCTAESSPTQSECDSNVHVRGGLTELTAED